jgi:hypothetical protein
MPVVIPLTKVLPVVLAESIAIDISAVAVAVPLRLVNQARLVKLSEIAAALVHLIHLQAQRLRTLAVAAVDMVLTGQLTTTAEQVAQAAAVMAAKVTKVQIGLTHRTEPLEQLISELAVAVAAITG